MALMGKKSRSVIRESAMKGMAMPMMDKPDHPKRMSITQAANGGFIVRPSGGAKAEYESKEEVYDDLEKLEACVKKHFGKGEKKDS